MSRLVGQGLTAKLAFLALAAASVALMRTSPASGQLARGVAGLALVPVERATETVDPESAFRYMSTHRELSEAKRRLAEENKLLRARLAEAVQRERLLEREIATLKAVAADPERRRDFRATPAVAGGEVRAARLAAAPSSFARIIAIDEGTRAGVAPDQAVVYLDFTGGERALALAGKITSAGPYTAEVRLVGDPRFAAAVRLHAPGVSRREVGPPVHGILEGTADGRVVVRHVARGLEVERGAVVTTSGLDGIFPPGILVGWVASAESDPHEAFQAIEVHPAADLGGLDVVAVLAKRNVEAAARSTTLGAALRFAEGAD
jgi:rod shape-determining protein MreC